MSKYYFDTEFLEGTQKERFPINLFRKETKPTIDLISIGLVSEDGREYYAVSKDFNLKEAWNRFDEKECYGVGSCQNKDEKGNCSRAEKCDTKKVYWIRDNVLKPIYEELLQLDGLTVEESKSCVFDFQMLSFYINKYGKSNKRIAEEIKTFVYNQSDEDMYHGTYKSKPEFYAYYSSYDWCVFCWLFGKMIDLPIGFPMYCNDLKQIMDNYAEKMNPALWGIYEDENADMDKRLDAIKKHPAYPKQTNEHSAIHDARFNKKLHEFLQKL